MISLRICPLQACRIVFNLFHCEYFILTIELIGNNLDLRERPISQVRHFLTCLIQEVNEVNKALIVLCQLAYYPPHQL